MKNLYIRMNNEGSYLIHADYCHETAYMYYNKAEAVAKYRADNDLKGIHLNIIDYTHDESTWEELKPVYSSQKSYYRKAYTSRQGDTVKLKSYDTVVCEVLDGDFVRLWDGYSRTTMEHVNEFRQQLGLPKLSKSEWEKL